ncbi:DUF4232 domain-containing protein [Micromonospora terminaliae]|uniref:DUF4232 domain-containing protein n=1 Tax=Micromonospora terminaliae TaxID=1914461 RepID=A0AAJ3DPF5_9ACTN|nr:DUF4232 domain-containing protein [Micromonospora terminaliae]NES31475.1 DUF4232 domain-containing protein [Micromonospora terminaliae]QGL49713.1 DUF4232 domain-containing protein [Micromonospora terminaliae]
MKTAAARIGALAGVALLAACTPTPTPRPVSAPAPPTPAPSTSPPPPACSPEGIRITELGVSAAMGLRAMGLELVNCGDRPYELRGYPAPRLRDADRDPLKVTIIPGARPITSGFDQPPTRIVLRPGERASAALLWRNLVTDATVVASNGAYLDVAPLPGRPAYPVELDGPIDLGNTGRLGVSAWKRYNGPSATQPPAPSGPPSTAPTPDSRL